MSNLVVTLWYRPPEILLGSMDYDYGVDMWSYGCIVAELLIKDVLLRGNGEIDQLNKIIKAFGGIKESDFPKNEIKFKVKEKGRPELDQMLYKCDENEKSFVRRFLIMNSKKRCSANEALNDNFLKNGSRENTIELIRCYLDMDKKENEALNCLLE
ncbi:putative cell division protein kinase [Dictyocoela roeselum]|nr:putative cell division protein kinase [Dictyocoela roeselum]